MPAKRSKFKPAPKPKSSAKAKSKLGARATSRVAAARDTEQLQIELGYKTAISLLAEITLPDGIAPSKESLKGLARIDKYPDFIRVTKGKQTYYPAKEAIFKAIGTNIDAAVTFCYLTLETDVSKSFDVDHVCPRDYFVQKQKLLLDYLNENSEFAQGFLGEQAIDSINKDVLNEHRKKIGIYFLRDKSSGEIQATKWLCDAFYNSTNNLTYLQHYINREKREMPPSLWLERSEIHEEFKQYLLAHGGVSEGVIMQGVIKGARDKMKQIVLKGTRGEEDITVYLHQGAYQGLGDYIRSWFLINKTKTMQASRDISGIKDQLYDVLTDEFHGRMDKKEAKLEKTLIMINGVFSATRKFLSILGSSSSDSSVAKKGRGTNWQITAVKALRYMSMLKRLKKMISRWIAPSYKETFEQEFYNIFLEKGFPELPATCLDEACRIVEQTFGDDGKENRKQLSEADFIKFVDDLMEQVDPVKQSLRERSLREAAEKENAQLKALLASAGIVVPGAAQIVGVAQVAAATPASATTVKRPIRRAAPLATSPQQQPAITRGESPQKRVRQRDDSMDSSPKAAAVVAMAPAKKRKPPALKFD